MICRVFQRTACPVAKIGIKPYSSITSEVQLFNQIAIYLSYNEEDEDYMFTYQIYAKGDVNHDGLVNQADSTFMLQYLSENTALDIKYVDGSNHYSFVTNVAAADFNLDGIVNMVDIVKVDQYLAAN